MVLQTFLLKRITPRSFERFLNEFDFSYLNIKSQRMVTVIKKGTPKNEIREKIRIVTARLSGKNPMKFAGKLKEIKDPLEYQIAIRNEWK